MRSAVEYYPPRTIACRTTPQNARIALGQHSQAFDDMTAQVPETMAACADFVENDILRDRMYGRRFQARRSAICFVVCKKLACGDGVETAVFPKDQPSSLAADDRPRGQCRRG